MPIPNEAEKIRSLLSYDPLTGALVWSRAVANVKAGSAAGVQNNGYHVVRVCGKLYRSHRIAWLCMTGEWPQEHVDHKNGDGLDNRWKNLRLANRVQNMANTKKRKDNSSGYKGVSFHSQSGKWRARITYAKATMFLGLFDTPGEAHEAYKRAAELFSGEFARAA